MEAAPLREEPGGGDCKLEERASDLTSLLRSAEDRPPILRSENREATEQTDLVRCTQSSCLIQANTDKRRAGRRKVGKQVKIMSPTIGEVKTQSPTIGEVKTQSPTVEVKPQIKGLK